MENDENKAKTDSCHPADLSSEHQLLSYQKKIENILESFTDAYFEVDSEWTVTYWNKEAERLLEMPREQIIGKNLWETYQDAIPLKFYSEYHRAVNENVSVRFEEYFHPKKMWVEVSAFPSGQGLSVYFKDITDNKVAVEQLEKERQKYIDLFNLSPVPQWVFDQETLKFLNVNEAAVRHYGYSRREFMHMSITDIRPPEDVDTLLDILNRDGLKEKFNVQSVRHRKKNGHIIYVEVAGIGLVFNDRPAKLVIAIDQTKRIEAEMRMMENINRFNIVSKATSDVIWDWDMRTGQLIWNQSAKGVFGYHETVHTSAWWQEQIHPEDLDDVMSQFNLLIEHKKPRLQVEYRFRCADGNYKSVLDRAFMNFDQQGQPIRMIGSMQDITERIKYINAIEAHNAILRDISWTQAHEFRAPLAKILGLLDILEAEDASESNKIAYQYLRSSADELDEVINRVIKKTEHNVAPSDPNR